MKAGYYLLYAKTNKQESHNNKNKQKALSHLRIRYKKNKTINLKPEF